MKNPRILVIGAGSSGIAAACRLLEHDFNNLAIYEAEDRIGGRTYSLKVGDACVDMGAQWCHGERDNIVYKLVKKYKILKESFNKYEGIPFYESDGTFLNRKITQKLEEIFWEIEERDEYEPNPNEPSINFAEYFAPIYKKKVRRKVGDDPKTLEIANKVLSYFKMMFLVMDSAFKWEDIAADTDFTHCDGEHLLHWGKHGFGLILDVLMVRVLK